MTIVGANQKRVYMHPLSRIEYRAYSLTPNRDGLPTDKDGIENPAGQPAVGNLLILKFCNHAIL